MKSRLLEVTLILNFFSMSISHAIEYHSALPANQKTSFIYDLNYLKNSKFQQDVYAEETSTLYGITGDVSGLTLLQWLNERSKFIVPETWDFDNAIVDSWPQSYANLYPTATQSINSIQLKDGEPKTVMINVGAAFYIHGKMQKLALKIKLDEDKEKVVNSPRIGIIQVGEGLFYEGFRITKRIQNTPANAISRLSVLFHESRHSDGNGSSLSFKHSSCPPRHAYQGKPACDKNRNGPYTTEKTAMKLMVRSCVECTEAEKEILRADILDSADRVILTYDILPNTSETRMLKYEVALCDLEGKTTAECSALKIKMDQLIESEGEKIVTKNLNTDPEKF